MERRFAPSICEETCPLLLQMRGCSPRQLDRFVLGLFWGDLSCTPAIELQAKIRPLLLITHYSVRLGTLVLRSVPSHSRWPVRASFNTPPQGHAYVYPAFTLYVGTSL